MRTSSTPIIRQITRFMVALLLSLGFVTLSFSPLAAAEGVWQPHSHASLQWDPQVTDTRAAEDAAAGTQADPTLLSVDLWLDSTPNFGGMYAPLSSNGQSIYKNKLPRYAWPEGGFHYLQDDGTPSWYVATLRALSDIAKKDTSFGRVRVLRYGDEILPYIFLVDPELNLLSAAATDAALSAVRRDMMTYAIDPTPGLWASMVGTTQAEMAQSFYAPESTSNYRLSNIASQVLERQDLHEQMISAQEVWRQLLADPNTKGTYTLSSSSSDVYASPLAYALDNMNWNNLNIITLDTLSYDHPVGRKQMPGGTQIPVNTIEELLLKHEVFTKKGLAMGIVACRADYTGFITRLNGALLDEALLWGKVSWARRNGQDLFPPHKAPAPRTFLMLLIGPPAAVDTYMSELAAAFDGPQFAGQRGLRMNKSSFLGTLPFYFDNETRSVSTFAFDYRMHTIRGVRFTGHNQADAGVQVLCETGTIQPGGEPGMPMITLTYDPYTIEENDQISVSLHVDIDKDKKFTDQQEVYKDAYRLQVVRQLALQREEPNDPKTIEGLENAGTPFVLKRNKAYVYGPDQTAAIFEAGQLIIQPDAEGAVFTLPVTVDRKTLRPGYYRINLRVQIDSDAVSQPLPSWIQRGGMPVPPKSAGQEWDWEASGASWGFTPDAIQTGNWMVLAAAVRSVGNKAERLSDLEHAWYSKKIPASINANIPPVFQVFYLNDVVAQIQNAVGMEAHTLIDYTFDVHVVFAGEEAL